MNGAQDEAVIGTDINCPYFLNMEEHFLNIVETLRSSSDTDYKVKYVVHDDDFFYKFYAGDVYLDFVQDDIDYVHELIRKINLATNNLIVDYKIYEDIGALYFKCKYIKFEYKRIHNKQLLERFSDTDSYLKFCVDNIVKFSSTVWPSWMSDFAGPNMQVSSKLECVIIDFDDMFEPSDMINKTEFIEFISDRLSRNTYDLIEPDYAKQFVKTYLEQNIIKLDFIPR